jgi:hypothetical protein
VVRLLLAKETGQDGSRQSESENDRGDSTYKSKLNEFMSEKVTAYDAVE